MKNITNNKEVIVFCEGCKNKFYTDTINQGTMIQSIHENNNPGHVAFVLPYEVYLEKQSLKIQQ